MQEQNIHVGTRRELSPAIAQAQRRAIVQLGLRTQIGSGELACSTHDQIDHVAFASDDLASAQPKAMPIRSLSVSIFKNL